MGERVGGGIQLLIDFLLNSQSIYNLLYCESVYAEVQPCVLYLALCLYYGKVIYYVGSLLYFSLFNIVITRVNAIYKIDSHI